MGKQVMRKKVVGFISVMSIMAALTSGCNEKEPVEALADTPGISWAEAEKSLLKISEENVARYVSRLDAKVATAIELLDKSNGKTNDNNLSRASLSSYLITVEDFMNKSVPGTVEEQVEYRRKAQIIYGELSARVDRVVKEYNSWVEEHDEHLNKIEDVDSLVKGSTDSWTDLESKLKANNGRFTEIERKREAARERQLELDRRRAEDEAKAKLENEKKQSEEKVIKEKSDTKEEEPEKEPEQSLETEVDYTITVSDNVTYKNDIKTVNTDKTLSIKIGDIVKVVDNSPTIYRISYTIEVPEGEEIAIPNSVDIIFVYVDDDNKYYAGGEILAP